MGFWRRLFSNGDDYLDGCAVVLSGDWEVTDDDDIDLLVVFASELDGDALRRLHEYRREHGG